MIIKYVENNVPSIWGSIPGEHGYLIMSIDKIDEDILETEMILLIALLIAIIAFAVVASRMLRRVL